MMAASKICQDETLTEHFWPQKTESGLSLAWFSDGPASLVCDTSDAGPSENQASFLRICKHGE